MTQTQDIDQFLRSLIGVRDWNAQYDQIRRWAEAGGVEVLLAVAATLTDEASVPQVEEGVRRAILERVQETLALTLGLESVAAALQVSGMRRGWAASAPPNSYRSLRLEAAPMLAQAQPSPVLGALFERFAPDTAYAESLLCLVQEMVLRGTAIVGAAAAFWGRHSGLHPLARLPLRLLPIERRLPGYLPSYGQGTKNYSTPGVSAEAVLPLLPPTTLEADWIENPLTEPDAKRLRAAVENWETGSNGRSEARLFRSDMDIPPSAITAALVLSLPLACLEGAFGPDLTLNAVSPADVLSTVFAAAGNGGAYSQGLGGAYGRLAAWEAFGALAGAGETASIEAAAVLAESCAWFSFTAKTAWFYSVAWDFGLVALRPDRRTLAVLAATDTD